MRSRHTLGAAVALASLLTAAPAFAAGWDTPILYSAEHMGMGGAAIAYVDDPSAIYHNPAGLVRTHGLSLMADTTLILGSITGSPTPEQLSIDSDPITAVAPLVAASYSFTDWFAAGVAFYPVASAGAVYNYNNGDGAAVENSTNVVFLEVSPSIAFRLPGSVNLGIGYRISYASLKRINKPDTAPLDFDVTGWNFEGLRVGAQWDPLPELQLGVVYRHKTTNHLDDPKAVVALASPTREASTDLVLPSKLGFGSRINLGPTSVVLDAEYTFQSQNEELVIETDPGLGPLTVNNVFRWKDTVTVRAGVEYGIDQTYFLRGGFILDSQATQKKWPSAFGTPPAASYTGTLGFGYRSEGPWEANIAVAYRTSSATVTEADINAGDDAVDCAACGDRGDYSLTMFGIYLDFTYSFDI